MEWEVEIVAGDVIVIRDKGTFKVVEIDHDADHLILVCEDLAIPGRPIIAVGITIGASVQGA